MPNRARNFTSIPAIALTCVMAILLCLVQTASAVAAKSPEKTASGIFFGESNIYTGEILPESLQPQWEIDLAATPTASGRQVWLSADPIGESGGLNLYGYVGNDPLNAWDPLGLCEYGLGVSATAAAVGGATVGAGLYGSDNYDDKWYDRFGVYGTFGGVIGASIGVTGNVSKFDRGAFRGASTGLGVALVGGIDLYKSTDPNAPADPFGDAGDLLREATQEGRQCDSGGASLSAGLKASFGATISINRTGVITPGSVGRAIKRAWNYFF